MLARWPEPLRRGRQATEASPRDIEALREGVAVRRNAMRTTAVRSSASHHPGDVALGQPASRARSMAGHALWSWTTT